MRRFVLLVFILSFIILSVGLYKSNNSFVGYVSKQSKLNLLSFEVWEDNEFIVLDNSIEDVVKILNIEIVGEYVIDGNIYVEGYISGLNKSVCVDGLKMNIQLSQNNGVLYVGYPLIKKCF